jgi:hypothetical protein
MDGWREDRSLPEKNLAGIGFGILGRGLLTLCGLVVMLLWNWLMPEIFVLGRVDYRQARGVLILSSILRKNSGFSDCVSGGSGRRREKQLRRQMREVRTSARDDSAASSEGKRSAGKPPLIMEHR